MTKNIVRMGVIGTGRWASWTHLSVYKEHPQAELVAVCDVVADSAENAAKKFDVGFVTTDYLELIARTDVDAVDIVTPNVMHSPVALAALKAGKHVVCEKPLAMNYQEAVAMANAAREAKVKTGINFIYRRHPAAQFAHAIIQDGHLGRIFHVNASYMQGWLVDPQSPLVWRLQKEMTGTGVLGDLGSHILDLVEWMTGERISSLVADMQTFTKERPRLDGSGSGPVDVDDEANLLARFENGAMGVFISSRYGTAQRNYQHIEIYGDKGSLIYRWEDPDHIQAALGPVFVKEGVMASIPVPQRFKSPNQEGLAKYNVSQNLENFIEAVLEDKEMVPNFNDGLRNQEILEAIEISTGERRWVDLPLKLPQSKTGQLSKTVQAE